MVLPQGLPIGRHWSVGKQLGDGVCGTVHILEGSLGSFAVKLAPVPSDTQTKKLQRETKRLADVLHYEGIVYQNQLNKLRGTMIPDLPQRGGPPIAGEVQGYRFLVMEKMKADFDQVVQDVHSGKRAFGDVASQLIDIVEAIHDHTLLIIDMKPENFMINSASQIVMIDLGLLQSYGSMGGHRPNVGGGPVIGTPLYSSQKMHQGETPSRRDDLEALCYMLIEVVLGDLPWSHGRSEDEIGSLKESTMESTKIWKDIAAKSNAQVSKALKSFYTAVCDLDYKMKPEYKELKDFFKGVNLSIKKASSKISKKTSTKKVVRELTPPRRSSRRQEEIVVIDDDTEDDQIEERSRKPAGRSTRNSKKADVVSEIESSQPTARATKRSPHNNNATGPAAKRQELESSDVEDFYSVEEDDFATCLDATESMDWETIGDAQGVTLTIVSGPHEGETLSLIKGERESVVFGIRPDVPNGYELIGDSDVDPQHVRLDLQVTKKLATVMVKDLRSACGTYVDNTMINKSQKAFINDVITIGTTSIKIRPLQKERKSVASVPEFEVINVADVEMEDLIVVEEVAKENKGPSVLLVGEDVELELSDSLILGSHNVRGADAQHCKLTLAMTRNFISIQVKDLKSSSGTYVNDQKIGTEGKLFLGDTLTIADTVLKVKKSTRSSLKSAPMKENNSSAVVSKSRGFSLSFVEGPHKGESVVLSTDGYDTVVLGANPRPKSGGSFALVKDKSVSTASHVRLELDASKKGFCKVTITDLSGGTQINQANVGKGKKQVAFANDTITIGKSVLKLIRL